MKEYKALLDSIKPLGAVCVAFSGGVDSTLLLKAARDALGENAAAVTVRMHSMPARETREAEEFCKKEGIRQIFIDFDEFKLDGFIKNPPDRCYICKKAIFEKIISVSLSNGFNYVLEGSNADDTLDYRPGERAVKKSGALSPLKTLGFTKQDIREISERLGLPTSKKPSFACLATRIPYGDTIDREKITMIDKAEQYLFDMGFTQVRVRLHGTLARIEVMPDEIKNVFLNRERIYDYIKSLGFNYVSLDLGGYRTGSMNEVL